MRSYSNVVLSDATGLSVVGAQITVYQTGTNDLATLWPADDVDAAPMVNPFRTDGRGEFIFYAADGRYDIAVRFGARAIRTVRDIELVDALAYVHRLEAVEDGEPGAIGSLRSDLVSTEGNFLTALTSAGVVSLTPERFGGVGYATADEAKAGVDSTAAVQKMATFGGLLRLPVTGQGRWYKVGTVSWPSHTRCSKLRLFVRDSNRDVQPVLIDGRQSPKSDYIFEDLEIHGNRLGQTELGYSAAGVPGTVSGTDSQRSGVVIQGRVSDVSLVRPKIWYCAVDGIWIYHDGRDNDPAALNPIDVNDLFIRNVTITEPDLRWNGRHGGSSECIDGLSIIGGISTRNGYDMPGYPKQPYSDGGNGRTTNSFGGPKYGRAWDCESYLVGTRYKNHVIDGLDGRGNWGGSVLFYHRLHPGVAGDVCENLIIRNCLVDDNHGASGDGSITVFALNDQTGMTYAGADAFKVLRLIENRADDNYLNINNATDIEVRGGWVSVTTSVGYSVVFGACADVRYCDIASNKPVFGRPMGIARMGTNIGGGWTVTNETLTFRHDLPTGAARYRYTASVTPAGAGQAKATVTFTAGWRLTPTKPSSINSTSGNLVMSDAFPSSNGANAIDYYIVANGLNPTAFIMEFDAERIS